jgi:hypothetical protein
VSELPRRDDDEHGSRAAGALIRRLKITWPKGARRLSVLLLPDCDDDDQTLPVTPLTHWLTHYPLQLVDHPRPLYCIEGLKAAELSPPGRTTGAEIMRFSGGIHG